MLTVGNIPQSLDVILLQDQEINSIIQSQDKLSSVYGWTIQNVGADNLVIVISAIDGQADTTHNNGIVTPAVYNSSGYSKGIVVAPGSTANIDGFLRRQEIILSSPTTTTINIAKADVAIAPTPVAPPTPTAPILIELGNIYRDPATSPNFAYYTRALKSDGSVVWIDATGAEVTPPTGLQPVNDDASKVVVNECRIAVANGTGYTTGDRLQNSIIYNHRDAISTVLWFNLTAGTQIATPLTADTEPCDAEQLRKLEDIKTKLDSVNTSLTSAVTLLTDIDTNTDEIETKIEDVKTKLDTINTSIGIGNTTLANIDTQIGTLVTDLSAILTQVTQINTNTADIEVLLGSVITVLTNTQTLLQTEFDETQAAINNTNNILSLNTSNRVGTFSLTGGETFSSLGLPTAIKSWAICALSDGLTLFDGVTTLNLRKNAVYSDESTTMNLDVSNFVFSGIGTIEITLRYN